MAGPTPKKSFLERCVSALVPSNWGIKSNWAKIPLSIVSPIWVGPGALYCYAAHKTVHLGHIPDLARGTQMLRDTRIVPGTGGLPTLRGPNAGRMPTSGMTPSPGFRAARIAGASGFQSRTSGGAGAFTTHGGPSIGGGTSEHRTGLQGVRLGGGDGFRPRLRPVTGRAGGLTGFDVRLNVPGLSGRAGNSIVGGGLRTVLRPTNFNTGGLTNFDTRLTVPPMGGGAVPTSFGTGGLSNFNTTLNVPGLTPFSGR